MALHVQSVVQTLVFHETVRHNQHVVHVHDTLAFFQADDAEINAAHIYDNLVFGQTVTYTISGSRAIVQTLDFTQNAWRTQEGYAYQNLVFRETVDPGNRWKTVSQALNFTETVQWSRARSGSDFLAFTQTIHTQFNRTRLISQTLAFNQYAVAYKRGDVTVLVPTAPVTVTTTPTPIITVTLPAINPPGTPVVSFAFGAKTISLRVPEFGDSSSITQRRIQRESRGGDLLIYRDPTWTIKEDLEISFTYISDVDTQKMQAFVKASLGQLIIYTDYLGNQYLGVITSPDLEITSPGRFNNAFTIKLEVIYS